MNETTTTVALKEHNGMVVLEFPTPVRFVSLEPEQAKQLGIAMAKESYRAEYGITGHRIEESGARIITKAIEDKLINRIAHAMVSMQNKKKSPVFIAAEVMGIVLREVS